MGAGDEFSGKDWSPASSEIRSFSFSVLGSHDSLPDMVAPSPPFFVETIANLIVTVWPRWDSIDATTTISSEAQLAAIGFFFIALIVEVFALGAADDRREKKIARVGLIFFFLCAGAEYVNSKYETRK